MDFCKLGHGFVKIDTWISLSCYMDLKLFFFAKQNQACIGSVVPLLMFANCLQLLANMLQRSRSTYCAGKLTFDQAILA